MPAQDTSKKALEKLRDKLPKIKQKIFDVMLEIGPTHNNRILEYLNQKESLKPRLQRRFWEINQVCGRVRELVRDDQIVRDLGPHRGRWHNEPKVYHLWAVKGEGQNPAGWTPVPSKTKKQFTEVLFK